MRKKRKESWQQLVGSYRSKLSKGKLAHTIAVVLLTIVVCISIVLAVLLGYLGYFESRVLVGVRVAGVDVGGLNRVQLRQVMESRLQERLKQNIRIIKDGDVVFELSAGKAMMDYDIAETVEMALKYGKDQSNLNKMIVEHWRAWRYGKVMTPIYSYNKEYLDIVLADALRPFERVLQEPSFEVVESRVEVRAGQAGYLAMRDPLFSDLEDYWSFVGEERDVVVRFRVVQPEIGEELLWRELQTAQQIFENKVSLSSDELAGQIITVEGAEVFDILEVMQSEEGALHFTLEEYKLAELLADTIALIDRDPVDAKFEIENGRVVDFAAATDGVRVNVGELGDRIIKSLKEGSKDNAQSTEVKIPTDTATPAITLASVNDYNIRELVGQGKSVFTGSDAGRAHNVQLAASRLNGVLIAPGAEFSMYETIGDIEKESGYRDAYVIKNGRTIPGVGGGVCQVSTTLFRAALDAGLEITERKQHAYRVYYYEKDQPPGLDAAIYFPNWDFRFVNNYDNHILLQTKVDMKKMTAEFNFYGVEDTRSVERSEPVVASETPPPPDLHQEDPTLPRGEVRQVDYAVWGATVSFDYRVQRNGEILTEDTFKSAYRPWQAVYLVGTKEN
jgi:vancomycin resistance protein YoaR